MLAPAPSLTSARFKAADETGLVEEVFPELSATIKQVSRSRLSRRFLWPNDSET